MLPKPTTSDPRSAARSAFTLIELLVVMAIIALLAAMLVPVVRQAVAKGHRARCLSNLRQIALGATSYAFDHQDRKPPDITGRWVTPNVKVGGEFTATGLVIESYVSTHEIVLCPAIDPVSDLASDRHMWVTSPLVGSSYMYQWFHPGVSPGSGWPKDYTTVNETGLLSEDPMLAMIMDFNYDYWSWYRGPVRSHVLLNTHNIAFADTSAASYNQDEGLVVTPADKDYPTWKVWEVAHSLRR